MQKKSPLLFSDYLCTVKHRSLHTLRMCISVLTHLGIDSLIQKANVHPWPVWRVNAAALLSPDRSGGRYRLLFWVYESEKNSLQVSQIQPEKIKGLISIDDAMHFNKTTEPRIRSKAEKTSMKSSEGILGILWDARHAQKIKMYRALWGKELG